MSNVNELKNERKNLLAEAQKIAVEAKGKMNAEQRTKFEAMIAETDQLSKDIETLETRQLASAKFASVEVPEEKKVDENAAYRNFLRTGETRTGLLTSTSGASYQLPTTVSNDIFHLMADYSGVLQAGPTIYNTANGDTMLVPSWSDISSSAALVSEANASTAVDSTLSGVTLNNYKYTSGLIQVTSELVADSAFDIEAHVKQSIVERIGRKLNSEFSIADGSSKPQGFVPAATVAVTAASTTAFTFAELQSLYFALDPAYRVKGKFMMNDTIYKACLGLVDDDHRPLINNILQDGSNGKLFGAPVVINNAMTGTQTASAKILAFGDFSRYVIRYAGGLQVSRSVDFAFNTDVITYKGLLRTDADLVDASAIKILKNATA